MRGEAEGLVYTRLANPTVESLERTMIDLEGGAGCVATASGMAAAATVLTGVLAAGDEIVCSRTVYGGTRALMLGELARFGVSTRFVDTTDTESAMAAIRPGTSLIWLETPANPTLELTDIRALADAAKSRGALTVVDNTFATPLLQRPLEHGADVVVHSLTKALNGHSDVVAGALVARDESLARRLRGTRSRLGGVPDPHQAWLVMRGIRTLPLRLRAAQQNALGLAGLLSGHPEVAKVRFPGFATPERRALVERQMEGPGTMLAFELRGGAPAAVRFVESLELIVMAGSLGGVESLAMHPASMSHSALSDAELEEAGISPGLVRLSIGCESFEDLAADIRTALDGTA
jgi:cystathionine beta-lyase/cystathionine gamma-synthase